MSPEHSGAGTASGVAARPTLSSDQKAAIVVYSMGAERAEKLLSRMDEWDYRRFARAMNRLGAVDADTVDAVMAEFATAVGDGNGIRGGIAETRRFLSHFLDPAAVDQIMEEIGGPAGRDIWEKLSNTSDQVLFSYLRNEQPQSVAVILSRLSPAKAARVLQMFPEERAKAVVLRMTRTGTIDRQVMDELKATLQQDFLAGFHKEQTARRPDDLIGGMLNQMRPALAGSILQTLQSHDRDLAAKVQKVLFTFADFGTRVGSVGLQTVIKNCERDTLILALTLAKHNAPDVLEYFFSNMSKRVAEQMREEMQAAGPVRMKDAEAAQQEIVRLAQALAKSGEIEIADADEDDQQLLE